MSTDSSHLQEHIQVILKHEEEFLTHRTAAERVGDSLGAFVGSLTDHLILQVLLLAEKEIVQLSQKTSIDDVAQSLKDSMPSE